MRISIFLTTVFFLMILSQNFSEAQDAKSIVYLIPGQGADARQFQRLELNPDFEIRNIEYFTPEKGWNMRDFARALSQQIDTTAKYVIIGVSLGGMLATEMGEFLNPEKIILISSAKCRDELPGKYTFQKTIPINKIVPAGMIKWGAKKLQPLVEPDSKNDRQVFLDMLNDKDPQFLKRTIAMIIRWEREEYSNDIVHIHGDDDHTLPSKNVAYDYLIQDGSHMMVYTRADEISALVNKILLMN
jgi:pimeloyl-ACP methyl ester carboxylesterase